MPEFDISSHPHDAFFKQAFSEPARARAFFQTHLPAAVAGQVDWATLELMPGSFVQQNLQQTHSDLLFSVKMAGRSLRLFLLFEHQTTVDARMPLRMLGYVLEILQKHELEHGLPLPPVIGYVLHQGPDRWTVSTQFEDLFDLPPEFAQTLGPYLPSFRHALLDLTQADPKNQEPDAEVRVALELMKLARTRKLLEFFDWLAKWAWVVQELPGDYLRHLLTYAMHADSTLDARDLVHRIQSNPQLQGAAMSIAEKLRQEGLHEGLQKGRLIQGVRMLQEFLGLPVTPDAVLEEMTLDDLRTQHDAMRKTWDSRQASQGR